MASGISESNNIIQLRDHHRSFGEIIEFSNKEFYDGKLRVILYSALYKAGVKTTPQYPVDKYKLDLALFAGNRKLDIEVDGEMYHKDWNGELCYRDQLRNHRLFEMGWDVKRFWVYQIRDKLAQCISQVQN